MMNLLATTREVGKEVVTMRLDWRVLGAAMAATLGIGYILCVTYDLALGAQMYRTWVALLPGFRWISWTSFGLGLLETIAYGIFFGLVFAPLYNFFLVKVWKHETPRVASTGRS